MKPQIWHNPRCSKSRQTLELLKANGVEPEIILYKDTAPSEADIRAVVAALGKAPIELIRQNDAAFKDLNLADADDDTLIKAMAAHPAIIERPVVRHQGKAALGRPPEDVLKLFE
ncbi:MAG TPA: arsenate reductase (glutaredoxin) [Rhodobacteraceae bacterium]|nr:arsenate reductase (glutaredoxin) [Paracoccaceae bacterium]